MTTPLRRRDQSLAISGAAQGVFAQKAQRLGIGVRGVVIAPEAHVDRRDHRPALAVVGLGGEMRLDRRHRRLDPARGFGAGLRLASGSSGILGWPRRA